MGTATPFTKLSEFAACLEALVPDQKADRTDRDFVADGVDVYAEHYPAWRTADIGDGSKAAWELGETAGDLDGWILGYSSEFPIAIEELDSAGAPQTPQVFLTHGWHIEDRYLGGVPKKYLVFDSAPSATAKARVKWRIPWTLSETATTIPGFHHMSVVWFAADLKCHALASHYRKTVDAGTDLFDGISAAEGYTTQAREWRKKAKSRLGIGGGSSHIETGRVRRSRSRVFRTYIP